MAQKVTYSVEHQMVEVEASGILTTDDIQQAINDVRAIANEKGIRRVLVDQSGITSVPGDPATQFNVGASMAHVFKNISIAIVHARQLAKDYEFVAKVSQARGSNLQLFTDKSAAIRWLDEQRNE